MKLIIAIIQPTRLEAVKAALSDVEVFRLTVMDVQGFGRQGGKSETFRGSEYKVDFVPKLKLELLVPSGEVERVVSLIATTANTGKIGDGKIWSTPLDTVMRIRTGELGDEAV